MRHWSRMAVAAVLLVPLGAWAADPALRAPQIQGRYLEARSCDIYTGPCYANGEVGVTGGEAIVTWAIDRGAWNGVSLDGLKVIAVVRASNTLGNTYQDAFPAKSLLIVDASATEEQRGALVNLAERLGGKLTENIVATQTAPIETSLGECKASGCGHVKAGDLVEVSTRCLGGDDHLCGNEYTFYPPLTEVENALPAYTNIARFSGEGLGMTWTNLDRRSAFLGTFSL
ncbi:MAG: DUF1326 domain-containing protein [Candidatus Hydrogenedentes bacterium]|nr:DUF1326 domain-containing protein [Candidatus Hydrogenedentota bacterium]